MAFSAWLCLCLASAASALPFMGKRSAQVSALGDPFYLPPSKLASAAPGTVFRSRTIPATYNGQAINAVAYQLLYRTSSANGTAIATVTTVWQPSTHIPNQLVGYAEAEDSDASTCAPSQSYKTGLTTSNDEDIVILAFLNSNYTVCSPDHEGPDSAFSPGRLEGHAVLDGLRAVLSFAPLGFTSQAKVFGYGYSGGAIATGWAAALQPTYAPDLTSKLVGWAHGGTPANLSGTLSYLYVTSTDGTLFSGYGFGGVGGLINAYSSIQSLVNQIATAAGKQALDYIYNNCGNSDVTQFAFQKFQSTKYQSLGDQVLYNPIVQQVTTDNILGLSASETPAVPTYIVHAKGDEIIPVADVQALYGRYCQHGIKSLLLEIDQGPAEHVSGGILFVPNVLNFAKARFAGVAPVSGCQMTTTVLPLLDPKAAPTALTIVYQQLLTLLTGKIGVDDSILKSSLTALAAAKGNVPLHV